MREVQAAAKQQQALATSLIKAGELANICRPLAYVIALRWCAVLLHVLVLYRCQNHSVCVQQHVESAHLPMVFAPSWHCTIMA